VTLPSPQASGRGEHRAGTLRTIVFLSDYGLSDEFVGVCHGVIARVAPEVRVIDLHHGIPPQDVARGAIVLAQAVPYVPPNAVFLGIVDPGVGTSRRPIALETAEGALLVGPDNGLLSLATEALGGITRAVEISNPEVMLSPVSQTFHGRDLFSPAAAHLALGTPIERLGQGIHPAELARVAIPQPKVEPGHIHSQVLGVDRFGNLELNVRLTDLDESGLALEPMLEVRASGKSHDVRRVAAFGELDPGTFGAIVDSAGWVALVLNRGNASDTLATRVGDHLVLGRQGEAG
jgi:S-adenosyl-L-methionine hydrolase (adenosine-forming)